MALFFSTPSPPLFNHFICTSQRHFCNFNSHSAMKKLRLGLKSMYDCYLIPSVKKSIHMDYRFKCEQQKPALGSGVYNEEGNIISFFFFFFSLFSLSTSSPHHSVASWSAFYLQGVGAQRRNGRGKREEQGQKRR